MYHNSKIVLMDMVFMANSSNHSSDPTDDYEIGIVFEDPMR